MVFMDFCEEIMDYSQIVIILLLVWRYEIHEAPPPSQSMVSGGVCFPSVPALPQPPAGVFPYYAQHFSAAAELCEVREQK